MRTERNGEEKEIGARETPLRHSLQGGGKRSQESLEQMEVAGRDIWHRR